MGEIKNIDQKGNRIFSPEDVAAFIRQIFLPFAMQKKLLFQCVADESTSQLKLNDDDCKLIQLVSNIVQNAIKFTDKGFVNVKFENISVSKHKVELIVHVKDSGPGIIKSELNKIFEPFHSGGIGLAISMKLAELCGGTLKINSDEGLGTEVEIRIPYFSGSREKTNRTTADQEKKRVLVVDDDEMSMLLMSNILKKHAIPHAQATDGKEALTKLKNSEFDMVLTDINMPGFSGKELLDQLRSGKEETRNIPVVAVTSEKKNSETVDYRAVGFNNVLFKPFKEEDLMKTIYQNLQMEKAAVIESPSINNKRKQNTFKTDELIKISNNNSDFVKMMLEKFVAISKENTEKMLSALVNGDKEKLMQLAHKSIPSYHMLGLTGMAEQLQCIEKNIRDGKDLSESSVLVKMVHENTREVIIDITNYLKNITTNEMIK